MLNADATGPRVPAIMGKAEAMTHQRLLLEKDWLAFYQCFYKDVFSAHVGSKSSLLNTWRALEGWFGPGPGPLPGAELSASVCT